VEATLQGEAQAQAAMTVLLVPGQCGAGCKLKELIERCSGSRTVWCTIS
jgi:hypothetical protein